MQPTSAVEDPLLGHPRFRSVKILGLGSSGFVCEAQNLQRQAGSNQPELVAIKFLQKDHVNNEKYLRSEIANHRILQHPHVIQFREVFTTDKYVCIVMEFASGGTLKNYLKGLNPKCLKEAQARWFFQQLVVAVDYCHRRGVSNRDLKLENTLIHWTFNGESWLPLLKICDFGFSKADHESFAKSRVGTLAYMAPEVITNRKPERYDARLADVWSCGIMLYYMLFHQFPFLPAGPVETRGAQKQMMDKIVSLEWSFPAGVPVSEECKNLLCAMLQPVPQRISIERLQQHAWFTKDLAPGVANMNDTYLHKECPSDVQQMPAIDAVLHQAKFSNPVADMACEYDALIDDEIEQQQLMGGSEEH